MDTKRFYKKAEKGKFPTRFAVGTVIEGPTEWYSGALSLHFCLLPLLLKFCLTGFQHSMVSERMTKLCSNACKCWQAQDLVPGCRS